MSIKIGSKITKLNAGDTYKLIDSGDVDGFDTLKGRVDQHDTDNTAIDSRVNSVETTTSDNKKRIETAEGHLQTLQQSDQSMAEDITQLQGQVFTGIHLEDDSGNSFDGIKGIAFDGGTVQDDQGTGIASVVISPLIDISNGQTPGSKSIMAKALEFPGATLTTRDPSGANVGVITIPSTGNNGITISDGVTASSNITRVVLEGSTIVGDGSGGANIHIPFRHFKTIADRDSWDVRFGAVIDYDIIIIVDADENGFVSYYKFDSHLKKFVDYNAQGVVMSDSNGAIPKVIKTIVFGTGFAIQEAGDQEDAALVTYTGSGGNSGVTINGTHVNEFNIMPPIQFDTGLGTGGIARMLIEPNAYESRHGNACLVKLDMVTTVAGQHPHTIYMTEEIVPTGEYFNLNPQGRGIDVQDNTGGDTAVTGGQLTEALAKLSFLDIAPNDGSVKVWFEYKDPSDVIAKKILVDVNGNPLAIEKHFKADDEIGSFILAGAFMAKATESFKVVVETSFDADSKITLDPINTMVCLNQFSNGYETSVARIEFLRRAATQITPAIQKFTSKMLSLSDEIKGISQASTVIAAVSGTDTLNEFGVQNLTSVMVGVENGVITIKDAGVIADFYVDTLIDNTHTRMLRGKDVAYGITVANPDSAFEYEAYKWTGNPDRVTQVYSKRNDDGSGVIVVNDGWVVIKGIFISEQPNGNQYDHVLSFTVPEDANNIIVLVRPQEPQSPLTLNLSEFDWGSTKNFTGYDEIERYNYHEEHLRFDDSYAEYFLTNEGYASLRYTINNTPSSGNPMPVGKLAKGKAQVVIDNTVNQVSGSAVPQYDGAVKFLVDGEASISKTYNVWNEQGTDNTVTFWDVLFDIYGNETKIPDSERTFTVPKNTVAPGIVYSIPAYAIDVEKGQRVGGRSTSNKADGAYVQSQNNSEYLVQTIIELKELVVTADDTDLISAPLQKSLVVDRRYHEFSGNSSQNIQIVDLEIPSDVMIKSVTVEKTTATGFTSVTAEHAYNSASQVLTVHVGSASDGVVFIEFWSK